jgi:hypothetical protein
VLFVDASTNLGQDNANFFWDTVNTRLGLGTATPSEQLELTGNIELATTTSTTTGVIEKNNVPFLHDFHHPTGGGAVPDGHNIFIGDAGNFTLGSTATNSNFASYNVGIGEDALASLTTGYRNISIGRRAGEDQTTPAGNIAIGYQALKDNITGTNNLAIGTSALQSATSSSNVAIGGNALLSLTSGGTNTAIGATALDAVTTTSYNTGIGFSALGQTTGTGNTAIGPNAGKNATASNYLTLIGRNAGDDLTIGAHANIIIGYDTGGGITTGDSNTIIMSSLSGLSTTLSDTLILGAGTPGEIRVYSDVNGNTAIGTDHTAPDTTLDVEGAITGRELSADPSDPDEGSYTMWMSDGTGSGDDGDLMVKITAGGSTKTITLIDFSAF